MHDIHMVLNHYMVFDEDFDAICEDTGEEIHNLDDYWRVANYAISSYFD